MNEITTLQGPAKSVLDPRGLSDTEAGILFLGIAGKVFPGLTWRGMFTDKNGMAGMFDWVSDSWDKMVEVAGEIKDGTGDVLADTFDYLGDKAGDTIRLLTDEEILDAASRAAQAYASGGASEALRALTPEQQQVIQAAGVSYKNQWGAAGDLFKNPVVWVVGGVALLSLTAFLFKGRK